MGAPHSLDIDMPVPVSSTVVPLLFSLLTCVILLDPNSTLAPHPINGDLLFADTRQPGLPPARENLQHLPPGPPRNPHPSQPYQCRGTPPLFFRARSTTEGGASMGAAPKLKSSFSGVKTGGIWLVLGGAEKGLRDGHADRVGPSLGGWLGVHLPTGGN